MNKKIYSLISMICILSMLFGISALAATKTISSVSIKVNTSLEAGDYLGDADIHIGDASGGNINVYTNATEKYNISDATISGSTNKNLKLGDEIRIKITIEPNQAGDTEYRFSGTYSSSNVSISGGKFISASKKNGSLIITLDINPLKGQYEEPEDVEWYETSGNSNIGKAIWKAPDATSGYYDVVLYKGGNEIHRVESYKGTSYNFYPYMTSKGNYTFKVRTVAKSSSDTSYGKKSDWVTSDEFYLSEEYVSNGAGRINTNNSSTGNSPGSTQSNHGQVGWVYDNGTWYYFYPNGSKKTGGFENIGNFWYLFDNNGKMLTGKQTYNGKPYFFNVSGEMLTGWHKDGNAWYYMSTDSNGNGGVMITNSWITDGAGNTYYMHTDGRMAEGWTEIGGHWYYFRPGQGSLARDTYVDTFYVNKDGVWIR